MLTYAQITERIENTAKCSAIATLFVLPISTSATIALFLLTILLVLLSGHWKEKISALKTNPIALCFFGLYAIYLVGTSYSIGSFADIKHQLIKFEWLALAPLCMLLFREDHWQKRGINAFLMSMVMTLILSYIKYFQVSTHHFWCLLHHRLCLMTTTAFKDYIIQSFLMSLAAVIFLYRFISKKQWIYGLLFSLAAINILFVSPGRTGYIIFAILITYTLLSQLSFKKGLVVCSIGAVALVSLLSVLPGAVHKRINLALHDIQLWNSGYEKTSLGYRMSWQENALHLLKKRPILGYGTGSIKAAYATLPKQDTMQTGVVDNTSNEYLNMAIQFGSVGLILFLIILLIQWRYSFFLDTEYGLLIQTLLIALCIGNLANSWLMDFTQGHYYALMTALAFGHFSKRREPVKVKDHAYNDDVAKDILV